MITDWAVYWWDRAVARWRAPRITQTGPTPLVSLRWLAESHRVPTEFVPPSPPRIPLREVPTDELTDNDADRLLAYLRQPSEIIVGESFIDTRTGMTWVYDGSGFLRTPEADVPSEKAFMARFLAENPEWSA